MGQSAKMACHKASVARVSIAAAFVALALALGPSNAIASKQVIDYFGTPEGSGSKGGEFSISSGLAINYSGVGGANKGDVYIADSYSGNRIQRFRHDDHGTPSNPYDDSYEFISAWGTDVDASDASKGFEICTVAENCKSGLASGDNGGMHTPEGLAIDQDTGDVYVADRENSRVDVFSATGEFLRALGFDVVESGPDQKGTGYEICIAVNNDVCKSGTPGSGVGQLRDINDGNLHTAVAISAADGNPATGKVLVTDPGNQRINSYNLDGSAPSSIGSAATFDIGRPTGVSIDPSGIIYADNQRHENEIERYDSENTDGNGVGFLAPIEAPPLIPNPNFRSVTDAMAFDPNSNDLYVWRAADVGKSGIQQFGPINDAGLTPPPVAADDVHGLSAEFLEVRGMAIDASDGSIYVSARNFGYPDGIFAEGVYVLNNVGSEAEISLNSLSDVSSESVVVHGTLAPNGPPRVGYRLEYSLDGTNWTRGPETALGLPEGPQSIEALLKPAPDGLEPNTTYHVRIAVAKAFQPPVFSNEETFTTAAAAPLAETMGSPVRTATTARFEGRVDPLNSSTSYSFEYGDQGPCSADPCSQTIPVAAGSGGLLTLVSQQVEGLTPGTTYHYRVVGESPGGTTTGGDMVLSTRESDSPLTHGTLPGPQGSDRNWEQVNSPELAGHGVSEAGAISDDGNRVLYFVKGGTQQTTVGSLYSPLFAERTPSGWKSRSILPSREESTGFLWLTPAANGDLSQILMRAGDRTQAKSGTVWRLSPEGPPAQLDESNSSIIPLLATSADASRAIALIEGKHDPEHPVGKTTWNLYDVSSGTPRLANLLPDGSTPACGVNTESNFGVPSEAPARFTNMVSPDGSLLFFPSKGNECSGSVQLYVRDFNAGTTRRLTPPPLSGPECGAAFIKSTPDAAFFWTQSRLTPADLARAKCGSQDNGDVYRYDLASGEVSCVTCLLAGAAADVAVGDGTASENIAVSADGKRVYFGAETPLVRGAPHFGIYRVNLETEDLKYIAPAAEAGGPAPNVGDLAIKGEGISPDGTEIAFRSNAAAMNPIGGSDNGGTKQYYLYDDRDGSLTCVSCPRDGTPARAEVDPTGLVATGNSQAGPNLVPFDDGGDLFFSSPSALVNSDQNTAATGENPRQGTDLYEWRDGEPLLVTDGLSTWKGSYPILDGVTPSGRDVFFTAPAQYTQDALDTFPRLYDARIGGGFEFPPEPTPCPLEVCQGTPKGAPAALSPASAGFSGPGNPQASHTRKKKRAHKKKHARKHKHPHRGRANHNRRSAR